MSIAAQGRRLSLGLHTANGDFPAIPRGLRTGRIAGYVVVGFVFTTVRPM